MWQKQARRCYRQHPQKGWRWRKERYWGLIPGRRDRWVFKSPKTGKYMWKFSWLPKGRHILVKGRSSVDDPAQQAYWQKRQKKKGRTMSGIRSKLWYGQQGRCAHCGAELETGSETHIHHLKPKSEGGADKLTNLCLLHAACHRQVHGSHGKGIRLSRVA